MTTITDGTVRYFAPARGEWILFIKRNGQWFKTGNKRPLPECSLIQRLDEQLERETGEAK